MSTAFLPLTGRGSIGLRACPGREASLADDVATIAGDGVGMVLSLIETAEAPETIAQLPGLLAAHRIDWRHFSIRDFDVPAGDGWPSLAIGLHDRLDRDSRLLIHCWGGRGRSGMIALRLMVERGEEPAAALERLRAARPGAVETEAQLIWAITGATRHEQAAS